MTWDRKAERNRNFQKRKASKNKARTKSYRKTQIREKEDFDDIKNWQDGLSRDTD